jgi:NAD(P)-dependent dehydrogenase (short-subunit alcohol dehydrogenase family)
MSFDLDLTTRRALVTGGTKGVGAAVVETLREAGAHVLAAARSIPAGRTEGVRYIAADLSTLEGARAVAHSVLQQLGAIDILVNVLGGSSRYGLRRRQADHHEGPRWDSARPTREAERSRGPHRLPGLATGRLDYRYRVCDRRWDRSDGLN